jgi:AAHS family benzoate transporter-like MFS transporter
MLGSAMLGANLQLDSIFYVLAALGVLGVLLTLLVPMTPAQSRVPVASQEPAGSGVA